MILTQEFKYLEHNYLRNINYKLMYSCRYVKFNDAKLAGTQF